MFTNREQAAGLLVDKLRRYKGKGVFVMAIPRGAVGMGKITANYLHSPFDIVVVKKIGAPANPELAIGAIGPGNTAYWDTRLCRALQVDSKQKNHELGIRNQERKERERILRGDKPYPDLYGKVALVVDDGVATGATSIVAAKFLAKKGAKEVILATPVIARDTLRRVKRYFDNVICLETPEDFRAVGQFYEDFPQVSDHEVIELLGNS